MCVPAEAMWVCWLEYPQRPEDAMCHVNAGKFSCQTEEEDTGIQVPVEAEEWQWACDAGVCRCEQGEDAL